jgi:F0F1-type ATP synthase assembly protein I
MPPTPGVSKKAMSAAYTLTGALLGLGLLGYYLDGKLGTKPYLLLAGLLLGVVVGLYELWKAMFPQERDQ